MQPLQLERQTDQTPLAGRRGRRSGHRWPTRRGGGDRVHHETCQVLRQHTVTQQYPNGLVTNVQKGQGPSGYQSLAHDVAKYAVSPPSLSGAAIAMMASGSRTIIGLTEPNGWSTKPWMLRRLLAGWCSTWCPKASSASAIMGCRPPRRLPRWRA